jgi:hypothetical protein
MDRLRAGLALALIGALLGGCATTALDAQDTAYVRGKSDFDAHRWPEAQEGLETFLTENCRTGPAAGCERAVWMKMQADLQQQRPALAVVDAERAKVLGPPSGRLTPPIAALRANAFATMESAASSGERTARLEVAFRNDVGSDCRLLSFSYGLDLDDPSDVTPANPDQTSTVFEGPLIPGDHLVTVSARFSCKFRDAHVDADVRSIYAVYATPEQPGGVLVVSRLVADPPPFAQPGDKLTFDFQPLAHP